MPSWFSSHLVCGARGKPDTGDISQQNGRLQHAHDAPAAEHDLEGEEDDGQVCLHTLTSCQETDTIPWLKSAVPKPLKRPHRRCSGESPVQGVLHAGVRTTLASCSDERGHQLSGDLCQWHDRSTQRWWGGDHARPGCRQSWTMPAWQAAT